MIVNLITDSYNTSDIGKVIDNRSTMYKTIMVFTLEEDQQLSVTQRKTVKRMELQAPLDEHVNDDVNVNSLRGVIREELDKKN